MRIGCAVLMLLCSAVSASAQEYARTDWAKLWALAPAAKQEAKRGATTDLPEQISLTGKVFLVELSRQRFAFYENGRVARRDNMDVRGAISSGMQTPEYRTPTGIFRIAWKSRLHWSEKYDAPMPHAGFFGPEGEAIHAGAIQRPFASHGCVRVSSEMAARLWKHRLYDNAVVIVVEHARDFDRMIVSR